MTFNGWAVNLGGVMFTTCHSQVEWDELECAPAQVFDVLTDTPDGLGLPGLRTEDVTYFQRDGVKHFSDWYEPRFITLTGVFGPVDTSECVDGDCSTVREQVQAAVQPWKRTCCDTELVIFPDCYQPDLTTGVNVYPDGTFDVDVDGWTGDNGATVARVTTPVHTGAGALEITWTTDPVPYDDPTTTGQVALGATFAATPGERYAVSAWLYAATGDPMPVLGVKDSADDEFVYSDPVPADDTWHQVSVDFVVPDGGDLIPFVVNGEATTAGQLAYVDDVEAMLYTDVDRTLNGPFGVVGRPREFKYKQRFDNNQIYDFVARFDAVDQRMYVLDACGTPGYAECVDVDPGTQLLSACFEDGTGPYAGQKVMCFGEGGFCFTNVVESGASVAPAVVQVGGTERVYPTITLFPTLITPTIENLTTGEFITYDGTVSDLPVTINTEEGTAFDSEGNSMTHLLRGSLFLSLDPGNYEFRLLASGEPEEPGFMQICWRPTVVNA
jgi:hypothetical protein